MDYKKFVQVRKAIQRPLGYDLYYMGDKLARSHGFDVLYQRAMVY